MYIYVYISVKMEIITICWYLKLFKPIIDGGLCGAGTVNSLKGRVLDGWRMQSEYIRWILVRKLLAISKPLIYIYYTHYTSILIYLSQ